MTGVEDMTTIRNYMKNKLKDNKGFIVFVIIFFSMRWSFADHYRVPTGSMLPTIHIGDDVFVNKMAYDLKFPFTDIVLTQTGKPKRGEIIVFKYPKDPSINYVKRLIALPGDRVEIYNGFVKVNDKLTLEIPKNYLKYIEKLSSSENFEYTESLGAKKYTVQRESSHSQDHHLSFTVPKGQYFFMGDNRDNSADSRYWGFVPRDYLKGRVTNVLFSIAFDGIIPKIDILRFGKTLI